jgi:hypothetical protein
MAEPGGRGFCDRDLGPNSEAIGAKMTVFAPGAGWTEVAP